MLIRVFRVGFSDRNQANLNTPKGKPIGISGRIRENARQYPRAHRPKPALRKHFGSGAHKMEMGTPWNRV